MADYHWRNVTVEYLKRLWCCFYYDLHHAFFFLLFLFDCFSLSPALMHFLFFLVASFVSFPLACFYSFFLAAFLFPLVLRPPASTGGYSSLGWAETASLYNTDRLLCNQIPSVATSEDSLSGFLRHTHTHTHSYARACNRTQARTHATAVLPTQGFELRVCVFLRVCASLYSDPCTYNHSTWFILCLQGGRQGSHFHHFLFFHLSHRGFKGHCLQVSMFALRVCVSARPWQLYQTGDSGL